MTLPTVPSRPLRSTALLTTMLLAAAAARAQDAVTGVSATGRATFESAGIVATVAGDADGDASAVLEVRAAGGAFVPAHPLVRIDATRFIGSAFFLAPGTAHDLRVTLSDPDGVSNPVLQASTTTRPAAFPPANGTDFYVAPGGSDSDPGTIGQPFATVAHAVSVAQPGDEVILRTGVYYESVDMPRSGGATLPIVVRSHAGESAVMDGADPALLSSPGSWNDQGGGVWSTPLPAGTSYVAADGQRLYPYGSLGELQGLTWGTDGGFYVAGGTLYVRYPGGGTPAGATTSVSRFPHAFLADGLTDLRFEELEIRHYGSDDYGKGIYLRGSSRCVVRGCAIHHNIAGVWIKGDANENVVEGCTFHDTPAQSWSWDASKAAGTVEHGGVLFDDTTSGQGNVIRGNVFYDFFDGAHLCGGSHTEPDETDVYGNEFRDCNDDGFETDGTCINTRIWGNTIERTLMGVSLASAVTGPTWVLRNLIVEYGDSVSGSQFTGAPFKFNVSGQPPSGPMLLYHNTCASSVPGTEAFKIYDLSQWTSLVTRNNVFAGTDWGFEDVNSANDPVDMDADLIHTPAAARFARVKGVPYATLALFQAGTGQEMRGISAPPQFVDPASGDYTLAPSSPAVDAGIPIPGVNDGFAGAAPDMGAFELGAGAPVAAFAGAPLVGAPPLLVQFTDQSSGSIASWAWTFGDGGSSASASPSHLYAAPGSYDVSLTVTGPGGSDAETKAGYVTVTGAFPPDDYVSGRGRGFPNPNDVRVHALGGATPAASFTAYGAGQWGTLVSSGDIDASGRAEALTGPGPGPVYGPQVRAFQADGTPVAKVSFYAYGTLRYGVNVAGARLDGDPSAEVLSGAGPGAVFGPHVRGFNYDGVALTAIAKIGFFAYQTLRYGVNVASGDVDGDAFAEILTGPGPAQVFGAQLRGFDYDGAGVTGIAKVNFVAFAGATFGVNAGAAEVDGDAFDEILAGRGPGAAEPSQARGFDHDGGAVAQLPGFDATPYATLYGARVAGGDVDGDALEELVTGPGEAPSAAASVRTLRYDGAALTPIGAGGFDAFPSAYGVVVAAGALGF